MVEEVDTRKDCLSFRLVSLSTICLFFSTVSSFLHKWNLWKFFQLTLHSVPYNLHYRFTYFSNPSFNSNKGNARDKKIRSLFSCNKLHLKQRILSRVSKKFQKPNKKRNNSYNCHVMYIIVLYYIYCIYFISKKIHFVLVINIILLLHVIPAW